MFPQRARQSVDRAIRYVDYITRQMGNRRLPIESYSYYNQSSRKGSPHVLENKPGWMEWVSGQLSFKIQAIVEDPLTKMFRQQAESNDFYDWKIPFDPQFGESSQLEEDFNSGTPDYINRIRRANISSFLDNYIEDATANPKSN